MSHTPPQPVKLPSGRAAKYRRTAGDVFRALGALLLLAVLLGRRWRRAAAPAASFVTPPPPEDSPPPAAPAFS